VRNITLSEWDEMLLALQESLTLRWPALKVEAGLQSGLHLSTGGAKGAVDIRGGHGLEALSMQPHVSVTSGATLLGDLSDVEAGLYEYRTLLDALHWLRASTSHVTIWGDDACPCDHCGAKGDNRGTKCETCDGKGKR
jgi:hypothetical protein